jgi:hypothetical protein
LEVFPVVAGYCDEAADKEFIAKFKALFETKLL